MGRQSTLKLLFSYAKPFRAHFLAGLLALFLVDAFGVLPPLVLKGFVDQAVAAFNGDNRFAPFLRLSALYAAIALVQGFLRFLWRVYLIRASFWAGERVREAYFAKLQKLPPSFFERQPIGDLMALATNDVEAVRFAMGPGFLVLSDGIFVISLMIPTMLYLSPKLTLLAFAPMIALPFIVFRCEKTVHDRFEDVQKQFSKLSGFAQENLDGIRIIKSFAREAVQLNRFSNLGKEFIGLNLRLISAQSILEQSFVLAVALGLVMLILFGGPEVIAGAVSLGTFVAFTRYLENMAWPMMAFGMAVTHYQRGKTSLERIHMVLAQKEEEEPHPFKERRAFRIENQPVVEAKNLTFYYPGIKTAAINNVSFRIEPGSKTALIGSIGSGKSTLVKLLSGLYEVDPNQLFLFGTDVREILLKRRRELVSVAPQEAFLFSETLDWNVRFGELSENARVSEVLDSAGLSEERSKWGLGLPISEKGSNLSGGQRARIALARALWKKSPLIVLDDTLSSVDVETENEILQNLGKELSDRAVLMITHRVSNLWNFDQILVFAKGELVERGSPRELLAKSGFYSRLAQLQKVENDVVTS